MLSKSKLKLIFYTIIALSGNLIYSSDKILRFNSLNDIIEQIQAQSIALSSDSKNSPDITVFEPLLFNLIQIHSEQLQILMYLGLSPKEMDEKIKKYIQAYESSYGKIGKASKYATTACGAGAPSVVSAPTVAIADDLPPLVAITPLNIELYESRNPYLNNPYWEDVSDDIEITSDKDDLPRLVSITPLYKAYYESKDPYFNNPYWEDVNK